MKFETSNKPLSIFSFSSLTDIVMLLLIFFLITSQFVIQTGVKVKLPGSEYNEQTSPSRLIVTITEEQLFYLGNQLINIDNLAYLLEASDIEDKTNLVIRADKNVPIDLVIKVIDVAKSVNIEKFTIETEKKKL